MPVRLQTVDYPPYKVCYRPNSSDERVLREVIDNKAYRKGSIGFDVEPGEHWLDLGANIGAFAIYCALHGATADCYEPDPVSYNILVKNVCTIPEFRCFRCAVSTIAGDMLPMLVSSKANNFYRGTLLQDVRGQFKKQPVMVSNIHISQVKRQYDGVKMDIEGSEFGIIDEGLLPQSDKLCFEYHTSRDKSMANLKRRVKTLRSIFEVVRYPKELDDLMALGGMQKSFHDRVIYCSGRK